MPLNALTACTERRLIDVWPRLSLLMTRAAREGDVQCVERNEKLSSLPKLGKRVDDALLLSYFPHKPLVHDTVMVEGIDV